MPHPSKRYFDALPRISHTFCRLLGQDQNVEGPFLEFLLAAARIRFDDDLAFAFAASSLLLLGVSIVLQPLFTYEFQGIEHYNVDD